MTRLRMTINHQALAKTVSVLSNSVLLAANTYMLGSSFKQSVQDRRNLLSRIIKRYDKLTKAKGNFYINEGPKYFIANEAMFRKSSKKN